MMREEIDQIIQEIAVKHGISVGRDDPILILQTLNAKLIRDTANAQQAMLGQFKEELECIASCWSAEAKAKSERILNTSLMTSKEVMTRTLCDSAKLTAEAVQKEIDKSILELGIALRKTERGSIFNLIVSATTFFSMLIFIAGNYFSK